MPMLICSVVASLALVFDFGLAHISGPPLPHSSARFAGRHSWQTIAPHPRGHSNGSLCNRISLPPAIFSIMRFSKLEPLSCLNGPVAVEFEHRSFRVVVSGSKSG